MQYYTMKCNTMQYTTVEYSTIQYNRVQYSRIQHIEYSTIEYNTQKERTVGVKVLWIRHTRCWFIQNEELGPANHSNTKLQSSLHSS